MNNIYSYAKQSKDVSIDTEKMANVLPLLHKANWLEDVPVNIKKLSLDEKLNFLFVLDSISFTYWGEPKWKITHDDKEYDGARAMIECLSRAYEESIPILDPLYLKNLTEKDLNHVLRGNVVIPLFDDRLKILQNLGTLLSETSTMKIIEDAKGDAPTLVDKLSKLYWFNDKTQNLSFNKKSQLLTNDIHNECVKLTNTEKLLGCADYKIPQVLRYYGVLKYSETLKEKIITQHIFKPEDKEVLEIRTNMLYAINLLSLKSGYTRMQVNDSLWLVGQNKFTEPYHRCKTIYY